MTVRLRTLLSSALDDLRYEPNAKRVRVDLGGSTVVDTTGAVLVWEPRRIVPGYAVPEADVRCDIAPLDAPAAQIPARPVLYPSVPFAVHTAKGEVVELRSGGRAAAAYRLADDEVAGLLLLDLDAVDAWYDEDEQGHGHPRDPYHRVDVLTSSRHVRITLDGAELADSSRPRTAYETTLPVRWYLPKEDVQVELRPTATRTHCPYKGQASYWSAVVGDRVLEDVAWSYEDPLPDAVRLRGLVSFFDERLDVEVDGTARERPVTPWSTDPTN